MRARPLPFVGDAEAEVTVDVLPETTAGNDLAGEIAFAFDGEAILSARSTCRPSP
jgi:hypothetical protein